MKYTNMLKVEFTPAEIAEALFEQMKAKVPAISGMGSHTFNITVQVNPDGQVIGTSLQGAVFTFDLTESAPNGESDTEHLLSSEANARRLGESIAQLLKSSDEEDERQFEQEIIESRRREALND